MPDDNPAGWSRADEHLTTGPAANRVQTRGVLAEGSSLTGGPSRRSARAPAKRPGRVVSTLLALLVYVAIQLPGAVIWGVEVATRQTPALGFPGWTPPSTAWAYDSLVWSTTAAAALLAGLAARRASGAVLGVAIGVLLGALRYPFVLIVEHGGYFQQDAVIVGLLISVVVAVSMAVLGAIGSRWWWSRLIVIAACLPALQDQTRLVDVFWMALGRPNPTLPPSATGITPALVACGVALVLACSGLGWFGGRQGRFPVALGVALIASAVSLLVLMPARFLLLDAMQTLLPRDLGGNDLLVGVPWAVTLQWLTHYWWMFLIAVVIGTGLSLLARAAQAQPDVPHSQFPHPPHPTHTPHPPHSGHRT